MFILVCNEIVSLLAVYYDGDVTPIALSAIVTQLDYWHSSKFKSISDYFIFFLPDEGLPVEMLILQTGSRGEQSPVRFDSLTYLF